MMRTAVARTCLWSWRVWMAGYVAVVVAQPVLAGQYLSGSYDAMAWHELGAFLMMAAAVGAFGLAVLHAGVGRGPAWPVPLLIALFLGQSFQIGMGYSRMLAVHVPLGVLILATVLVLAAWVWSPAARRTGRLWRR